MQFGAIAAIATPPGVGGIGVIRLSGDGVFKIAEEVFHPKSGKELSKMKGYTAAFGDVSDEKGVFDEAVSLVFHAPKSYTGEDVVEISCHGGEAVLKRLLKALFFAGARMAEPGEFTKRAFLHHRIDLTKAEAIMDMISAKSADAEDAAHTQYRGALFQRIRKIKEKVYQLSAELAAYFDYPDEDVPPLDADALKLRMQKIQIDLQDLCASYEEGKTLREGVSVAIVGKPNVGKSTIMNRFLGEERSIVTEIAGTTRDIVEDTAQFAGITLHLSDTAGLHDTDDQVEKIGVKRARERLETAAIVLAVFDRSLPLDNEDKKIISLLKNKKTIAILNKSDLHAKCDMLFLRKSFTSIVEISAVDGSGWEKLQDAVKAFVATRQLNPRAGIISNLRQLECATRAKSTIMEGIAALQSGMTLDAVSVDLSAAADALSELTGEQASEEIIEKVFAQFCVGK